MEFNDDDEDEPQEEETEEEMNLHQNDTVYDSPRLNTTVTTTTTTSSTAAGLMILHTGNTTGNTTGIRFKYRECLKNQAVTIGGHALDGCGEFMPAGSEGTIDALKCAACGCHRNFHRKENNNPIPPPGFYRIPTPLNYQRPLPPPPLALPPPPPPPPLPPVRERSDLEEDDLSNYNKMETSSAEGGIMRKRFRTKFTAEQKEMMLGLAERIGWRIQRQDDELISRFCQESGVSRQVLKVWLHNNKHTLRKSSSSSSPIISHHHHHHHQQHQQNQHHSLFHQEQDQP